MKREFLVPIVLSCVVALAPMLGCGQTNDTTPSSPLKIAIPVREFNEFVTIQRNLVTGENNYSGFVIDVFREVMNNMVPPILFEFKLFEKADGTMNGTFDDMLQAVASKDYDGAVGEIAILFYRTPWVHFTMPYLESSITMLVPRKEQPKIEVDGFSLTRITYAFVITTFVLGFIAFFVAAIYAGTIWARCFGKNGNTQRDKTMGSLIQTRLMMITFFLIILTVNACYLVSRTSPITSQRGGGTVENLTQLMRNGANVGYRDRSFIHTLLLQKGFPESRLISLKSEEHMVEMLSKGTSKGGVDAIVAHDVHLKLLQAKYCDNFTMVPTTNLRSTGFGFAFGKQHTALTEDVSNGILRILDKGQLGKIQDRTIGSLETCQDNDPNRDIDVGSSFLSHDHRWILIVGGLLAALLIIVSFIFLF